MSRRNYTLYTVVRYLVLPYQYGSKAAIELISSYVGVRAFKLAGN